METIIACSIMVMAFTILAVIFGRAYTISKTIKRGSKNQRWGAYLMNTILYGPGAKTATEGLIAAYRVYHPDDYPNTLSLAGASGIGPYYYPTDNLNPSRYLCFSTPDKKQPIIYELLSAANTLYTNKDSSVISSPSYKPDNPSAVNYFNLKPTYAKDGNLELCASSGFYFYDEHNNLILSGGTDETKKIKRVGIKLVIKDALQNINQAIVLYQNVRIRNLYSSELSE